ncbi:hypothetical protein ACE193_04980 [Bernardetia sp. OM2101]
MCLRYFRCSLYIEYANTKNDFLDVNFVFLCRFDLPLTAILSLTL